MDTITELPLKRYQLRQTLIGSLLVSTIRLPVMHPGGDIETYVFPANPKTGEIMDWAEVWGERCHDDPDAVNVQHERGIAWAQGQAQV